MRNEPNHAEKATLEDLIEKQVVARGLHDPRLHQAVREVDRRLFVPQSLQKSAYEDRALSLPHGQSISQPYIVALMLSAAELQGSEKLLDVGTGSGYAAAVASKLVSQVYSVERIPALAKSAAALLRRLELTNIEVGCGDGTLGWPAKAPFDAILVAAAGPGVPPSLEAQLAVGGRLILPVGARDGEQRLLRVTREAPADFRTEDLGAVRFVPLIGSEGWTENSELEGGAP